MKKEQMPKEKIKNKGSTSLGSTGKLIANLRKANGLTQTELAKLLNLQQAHISHYERGRVRVPADFLIRLTRELKVTAPFFRIYNPAEEKKPKLGPSNVFDVHMAIQKLPRAKKKVVLNFLETYLKSEGVTN